MIVYILKKDKLQGDGDGFGQVNGKEGLLKIAQRAVVVPFAVRVEMVGRLDAYTAKQYNQQDNPENPQFLTVHEIYGTQDEKNILLKIKIIVKLDFYLNPKEKAEKS